LLPHGFDDLIPFSIISEKNLVGCAMRVVFLPSVLGWFGFWGRVLGGGSGVGSGPHPPPPIPNGVCVMDI